MLYQLSYQNHERGRVWVRSYMFSGHNTWLKYMNSIVIDVQQWQNERCKCSHNSPGKMTRWFFQHCYGCIGIFNSFLTWSGLEQSDRAVKWLMLYIYISFTISTALPLLARIQMVNYKSYVPKLLPGLTNWWSDRFSQLKETHSHCKCVNLA